MDWSNPVGSAVSGLFGIAGSALNYHFSNKLAEKQNEYNLQMWHLNNEYNSPVNQMKRYEEAGLNPSLLYGQISSGNAAHAPEQVTPQAPDVTRDMRDLGQAFNIEGLRTAIANRKKAQQEARLAKANADSAEGDNLYYKFMGANYTLDSSGKFVLKLRDVNNLSAVVFPLPDQIAEGKILQTLENNFRTNSLLVPRANLIGSQTLLNKYRQQYLVPQIQMNRYAAKYFPVSYWIGNAKAGAQTLGSFVPLFYY